MKLIYIAGPFRGKSAWDVAKNVREAEMLAYEVWRSGAAAICPHANTAHFDGTLTDKIYLDGTMEMLKRSDALVHTARAYESSGAMAEINYALTNNIPVFTNVEDLRIWLLNG